MRLSFLTLLELTSEFVRKLSVKDKHIENIGVT